MFMTMLSSYLPSPDDPKYREYECNLPQFRRNLEERYPQVCPRCEPRVKERIRQTGYEAKSDHMRRMMDRSKAGRAAASQNRAPNWKSLIVFIGAFMYWASLAGQLSWNIMGVLDDREWREDTGRPLSVLTLLSCVFHTLHMRRAASHCHTESASFAGMCLLVGMVSLWWNPKLRFKAEGRPGRLAGLGGYYKLQFLVMVTRCVFWAVFKDRSTSGLSPTQLSALHLFMILFTLLVSTAEPYEIDEQTYIFCRLPTSLAVLSNMTLTRCFHGQTSLHNHQRQNDSQHPRHLASRIALC